MVDLADKLRSKKVKVVEVPGWETHARPYSFKPEAIMIHHTASSGNSLKIIRNGRKGLPGPLAQFLISKSGQVYLVSQGYSNHAGTGVSSVLANARKDRAPSGRAKSKGDMTGNKYFWGVEVENNGTGEAYPEVQIQALVTLCAALCELNGWSANRIVHHKEWSSRKIDMSYRGDVRGMVADVMSGKAPRSYDISCDDIVVQLKDEGDCVREVQRNIVRHGDNITIDGDFGPNTDSAVKRFQSKNGLTVDGIVGPSTWKHLKSTVQPKAKSEAKEYPTLRSGSVNSYVETLRVLLNRTGYRVSEKGTAFTAEVKEAVQTFQRDHKLSVDGVVGPNTWGAIISKSEEVANRSRCDEQTFRKGDNGACVEKLQAALSEKGFKVAVDGDFGTNTESAVKHFQTVFKVSADGVVGPQTWGVLGSNYDLNKAAVYKGPFSQALAMLIAKKWGIAAVSYLDRRIVKHAVLVADADAYKGNYTTHRLVRGATQEEAASKTYDEVVNGKVAGV